MRRSLTMAEATPSSVFNGHKAPLIFSLIFVHLLHCQPFVIRFQAPSDCSAEQFFDISSVSCVSCGENQQRSATGLSCICKTGYQTVTTDKASITCQQCPPDKPAVTKDGFGCVRCPGRLSDEGKCQCPPGHILVERDVNGNLLDEARCETCNGKSSCSSAPDHSGDRCEGCQASSVKCNPPDVLVGGLCLSPSSLSTDVNPSVSYAQLKFSVQSAWFIQNLHSSSAACRVFSNPTACQALGNMCVMNMHSLSGVSNDACGLFNSIFRSKTALSSPQDISYWRANLPWLYYGDGPGLASQVLRTNPAPIGFRFRGSNKNTDMKLLAAVYNVRGEFLRWEPVGGRNLQLCPVTTTKRAAAFSFGTAYQESCDLSVEELLDTHPEPLFYDVFMDLGGDNRELLPLPTLVYNQQYNGQFINQDNMKKWYLTRRMFVIDALSGREEGSSRPRVIRVVSSVKIRFQLVPGTQKGQIFPPLMTVTYRDVPITDVKTQTVTTTFAVEYEMDQNETWMRTNIALGVMGGVAILYSLLKTVRWKRRSRWPNIDMEIMVRFLVFCAGDLANVFFAITVGTGLYWLILYKAQHVVSVLLPLPAQEKDFVIYIGIAFALKAVQFVYKLILQVSVDVFFIDWEKPRLKANIIVKAAGKPKRRPSIWRTFFVANEWNKIQTIRRISPTFQIVAVLFFLEVLGFSGLALRDPWSTIQRSPQAYTPPYSLMMRYCLAATLWLCMGLLQVIFFTVFQKCFVGSKIHRFVDLCSTSNISVLLLPQRYFGYYIHGRSVHGRADINMEGMSNNLRRESESRCRRRGLLPNSDVQTFLVSLTSHFRSQYDNIREQMGRRRDPLQLMEAGLVDQYEQRARGYQTLNHFLGSVLDHDKPNIDFTVMDKPMCERVTGMEFLEPTEKSIFYTDEAHSFKDLLFYGNEATLLIFDTLFFCVVDLGSQSFVLAALLTYVQQMISRWICNTLGRKNLVNKTLVDERFLL